MFQAIKMNNYQSLLATKSNRKVTFIINQFQVSIFSSTFSPCISPDNTLRIVLSLSINIVYCISPATCFANSFLFKTFDNLTIALFIQPPNAPVISGITVINNNNNNNNNKNNNNNNIIIFIILSFSRHQLFSNSTPASFYLRLK